MINLSFRDLVKGGSHESQIREWITRESGGYHMLNAPTQTVIRSHVQYHLELWYVHIECSDRDCMCGRMDQNQWLLQSHYPNWILSPISVTEGTFSLSPQTMHEN